jgi:hypothetical protein
MLFLNCIGVIYTRDFRCFWVDFKSFMMQNKQKAIEKGSDVAFLRRPKVFPPVRNKGEHASEHVTVA